MYTVVMYSGKQWSIQYWCILWYMQRLYDMYLRILLDDVLYACTIWCTFYDGGNAHLMYTLWWWCPMLNLMMFLILWWTLVPAHKPSVIITEVAEVTIQALTEVCMVQVQNSRDQVCKNAIWTVSRHIQ